MPLVRGIGVVAIEPLLAVVVALHVEDVRVAVGIGVCATPSVPLPLEYSQSCIVCVIIINQRGAPSIFIFEVSACTTLPQTVVGDILDAWILDSVADGRDPAYSPTTSSIISQV